jgi:hypothetical protein
VSAPAPHVDLRRIIAELRDALATNDRERFAVALQYPVRVNTDSRCRVVLPDARAFLPLFDQIVTPQVRRVIADAATSGPPESFRQGLGVGEVWLRLDEPRTVFNVDAWGLVGAPCADWELQPMPPWITKEWVFAAVASAQSSLAPPPLQAWQRASLRFDGRTGEARFRVEHEERCRPLRFGRLEDDFPSRLDPSFYGYTGERAAFLDLECGTRPGHEHGRVERVDVRSESSLIVQGNDGFFVLLRPASEIAAGAPAPRGAACGPSAVRCRPGLVCSLSLPGSDGPEREPMTCEPIR